MRLNIFRNPNIDAQVGYFLDSFDQAVRNQTEEYWRNTIVKEILDRMELIPKEDGGYCHVVHYCDVIEFIKLSEAEK